MYYPFLRNVVYWKAHFEIQYRIISFVACPSCACIEFVTFKYRMCQMEFISVQSTLTQGQCVTYVCLKLQL
jgi:hypothetical protein